MNSNDREAGVLLHITSLPSKHGVGTLGNSAYEFVDWMRSAGLSVWQVLPLVPTSYGDSPYQSVSSTALNYYMIDFDILFEKGLLQKKDYEYMKFAYTPTRVDYSLLFERKIKVLRTAYQKFKKDDKNFKEFLDKGVYNDFSLFMTIKSLNEHKSWDMWEKEYQSYSKELEQKIIEENNEDYLFWQWTQFEFLNQWTKLHDYAKQNNIKIMGDMPLYVAYDSVEVWKNPELFILDKNKKMILVAGCPPDAFSDDGQLWGNPVYNWEYLKSTNYQWWNERISKSLELVDILRIDHFRGFDRFYAIPAQNENAKHGEWLDGPHADLFKDKLDLKIVAEDLGVIDDGVRKLMKDTGYPGMKIIEFAFDGDPSNEHKPSNYTENYVVYTGTHDNMPLYQYVEDLLDDSLEIYKEDLKNECHKLNVRLRDQTTEKIVETVIELAFASKANLCIIPFQDLLHQGLDSRMNLPATVSTDNWSYRILKRNLSQKLSSKLRSYSRKYKRI